jgi:hypothetical protein
MARYDVVPQAAAEKVIASAHKHVQADDES